jgi:ubiquinone/menaquinone biosynthesis C-methylase UbiE
VLEFDEATAKQLEETYQTPDVVEQRRATRAILALQPGEHVLDIGSGPGFLAAEMAAEVGATGRVVGVDPSETMLAMAARRGAPVDYVAGDALALPVADGTFDAAVATQVYEYVADMPAALAEARRALKPGGRLLILDTDWDSIVWHSSDRDRMLRVLEKWNDHLADPYLPRRLPGLLRDAGFELLEATIIPILNRGEADDFSRGVMQTIADFVEDQGWAADLRAMGEDYFFSLNRYVFTARRGSS